MEYPIVNLNGTSGEELLNDINEARAALRSAQEALFKCSPHGRDYPRNDRWVVATREHNERVDGIDKVIVELGNIGQKIADQVFSRGWSKTDRGRHA